MILTPQNLINSPVTCYAENTSIKYGIFQPLDNNKITISLLVIIPSSVKDATSSMFREVFVIK